MIEIIAFDADDTLWHTESQYAHAQEAFKQIVSKYADSEVVDKTLYETEMRNLESFGYGIKSFTLSMIEAAIALSQEKITGKETGAILNLARDMLLAKIELLEGVKETISSLYPKYDLMVITKGDLLDQEAKLTRSGLSQYFKYLEILSTKTVESYQALFKRLGIRPECFLMVGNSLRSDILPVVALGGQGVYIPYNITWAHEHVSPEEMQDIQFNQLESMQQLLGIIDHLDCR